MLNRLRLRKVKKQSEKVLEQVKDSIAYCTNCGEVVTKIFSHGEFVLVATPGTAPFFGRVIRLTNDEDHKPMVIVSRGGVQTEKVNIAHLTKVDD